MNFKFKLCSKGAIYILKFISITVSPNTFTVVLINTILWGSGFESYNTFTIVFLSILQYFHSSLPILKYFHSYLSLLKYFHSYLSILQYFQLSFFLSYNTFIVIFLYILQYFLFFFQNFQLSFFLSYNTFIVIFLYILQYFQIYLTILSLYRTILSVSILQ